MSGTLDVAAATVLGLAIVATAVVIGLRLHWERCQDKAPAAVQAQINTMQAHRTPQELSGATRVPRAWRRTGRPTPALCTARLGHIGRKRDNGRRGRGGDGRHSCGGNVGVPPTTNHGKSTPSAQPTG